MVLAEEVCWPVLLWVWWFPLASLYTIAWWCLSPPYRYLFLSVIPLYSAPIPEWLPINWPIFSLAWWSRVHSARCTLLISRALNGRFVVLFRIWSELCRCDFVELCFSFRVRQCIIADWWGSRPDFSFNYKLSKASRALIHWWHKIIWQNNKLSIESWRLFSLTEQEDHSWTLFLRIWVLWKNTGCLSLAGPRVLSPEAYILHSINTDGASQLFPILLQRQQALRLCTNTDILVVVKFTLLSVWDESVGLCVWWNAHDRIWELSIM